MTDGEVLAIAEHDFDAIVCRWGLMFMPDVKGALRAMHQRLRPGGRVATSVWAAAERVPMISLGADAVRRIANLPPPPADALGPLRLADESIMRAALADAGFKDVAVERIAVTFDLDSATDFMQFRRDVSVQFCPCCSSANRPILARKLSTRSPTLHGPWPTRAAVCAP